jgi:predicted Zn-dependent protease
LKRAAGLLLVAALLAGCAASGPGYIPKSPFLEVPLSMRARDDGVQKRIAELEVKRDWPAIIDLAAPLVASDPLDSDWRLVLGYARLQHKQFDQAIAALAPIVERHPEEVDGHNLLGEAQRLAGQFDRARQTLERASFAHPHSAINRFLLGELYTQGNLLERARTAYSESVRIDPQLAPGWLGLVRVLARTGPRDEYDIALKNLAALDAEMARAAPIPQALRR